MDVRSPSVSTTGYADGLGRRSIRFDRESGSTLECVQLRPELAVYEHALQAQAATITALDDERFVRVRSIDREGTRVSVTSELLAGDRLSDIIDARSLGDGAISGLDAAFGFLLQVLPALSRLHAAGVVHGIVAPGRVILTASAQVVLSDTIYGSVLPRLNLSRRRLWTELQVAAPPSAGTVRFDASADVAQASLCGLMLALGRMIDANDPVDALPLLVGEAVEIAQIRGGDRLAESVRRFFTATLPLAGLRTGVTADQAARDAQAIANGELGEDACISALAEFLKYDAPPAPVPLARPAPVLAFTAAPPIPEPDVEETAVEETAAAEEHAPHIYSVSGYEEPLPVIEPVAVVEPVFAEKTTTVAPPVAIQEPVTFEEPPAVEPVLATEWRTYADSLVAPQSAAIPEPAPTPIPEPPPPPAPPVAVVAPEPIRDPEPVVAAAVEPPPPPPPPLPPAFTPREEEPLISNPSGDIVFQPSVVAPPPPVMPPPPVYAAPVYAPPPAYAPPPPPMPVFPPAPTLVAPTRPAPVAPNPFAFAPPSPPPPVAPPPAAAPIPAAPATLRLKQDGPSGYTPPRPSPRFEPAMADGPFVHRQVESAPAGFPKKLAIAVMVFMVLAVGGGRYLLMKEREAASEEKPAPVAANTRPSPAAPAKGGTPAVSTGTLTIESIPTGAKVLLNGTPAGATPLKLEGLPEGRHTVTLSTDSVTVKRTVRVEAGKTVALDVPVFSGWVAIFAPIVLDVSEGSKGLGSTEQGRILLPPGRHVLTVTNRQLGYSSMHTVEISAGEETPLNLTPTGHVNLNAVPWAEVWIDGNRAGETPMANFEVPLGTREFVFKHPQHGERRVTATITATPSAVSVDFTKNQ